MQTILKYLKTHGQKLDTEIAEALDVPIEQLHLHIATLSALGDISKCTVTRFNGGIETKSILCRPAAFTPPRSAGRTPASHRPAAEPA